MSDEERYGLRDEDPAECDIEWLGPSEDDDERRLAYADGATSNYPEGWGDAPW